VEDTIVFIAPTKLCLEVVSPFVRAVGPISGPLSFAMWVPQFKDSLAVAVVHRGNSVSVTLHNTLRLVVI